MSLFHLDAEFITQYVGRQPKWGPIGYVTYKRTYARDLDKIFERHTLLGKSHGLVDSEEFWLTLVRVTEGTFGILRDHCKSLRLPWSEEIAQRKAQEMFRLMWEFKFTPPGRGLWMMGTPAVDKVGGAALNNCAFVSTKDIDVDFSGPFCTLMDFSMLGVGVGGDARGAGKVVIQKPTHEGLHVVDDSREGWVEALRIVLQAFVGDGWLPVFDYSEVREAGSAIVGFGGTASGPEPLREMIASVCKILDARVGDTITSSDIVDIFNLVGKCVVAGNVRRSAEILFGEPLDDAFLELKDRDKHAAALDSHRWASNNSIFAKVGQSYDRVAKKIMKNGEPGCYWLANAQQYGRMIDPRDDKDAQALGGNPCQPAWATVLTPSGISTLGQVKIGDQIWSGKQWTAVTNKWSSGLCDVYAYRTSAGTFYGTEYHQVVQRGQKIEVCCADSIDRAPMPGDDRPCSSDTAHILVSEFVSREEVFDLTVDVEEHTYWTDGLLVSNCLEQTLHDRELCCLVENYPFHHENTKEFLRTLKFSYLYAKAVTLVPTHDPKTNAVTMKNRRIGCSLAGIVQAMSKFGRRGFLDMCDQAYKYICELDKEYSGWLCVPESIKKTSVKPGGSVPLLCQATPGIHHPIAEYYWRVIRFATDSKLLPALRASGHMCIEIDPAKEPNTTAVYFPVKEEGFERGASDVSMWEQLEIAAALQAHWADNQVSVTISFDKVTEGPQIARALELYETRLKGVSFMPREDHGYDHAPYQPITKDEYEAAKASLGVLDLSMAAHEVTDKFCDGDKCLMPVPA